MRSKKPYRKHPATASKEAVTSFRASTTKRTGLHEMLATNIADHMKLMQSGERATDWHFRVRSKFVRALQDHIVNSPATKCIVDRKGRDVACHRGTGYAIRLKNPILHFAMPGEVEYMSAELEIAYAPNEDDAEWERRDERDVERAERIHFPADLELNFTKAKFDLWVHETRSTMRAERAAPEYRFLEKLMKKHPDKARELVLKLKPAS